MTGDATTTPIHRLGAYELRSQIGEGGMGVVYRALAADGRPVAVKVLRPHIAGDQEGRDRFAREVRAMRRVRGPFVAEVVDANVTAETPYVVTRYVDGPPLYQVVAEGGPLTERGLVRLAGGLAEALEAIHAAGVVHRDLKPGNVLMLRGQPVVIDFGIAQVADETRLTSTGMLVGTPGYLAPEVIEGRPATWASDIHSWAATMAYAATGRPPFGRGPFEAVAFRVVSGRADLAGVPDRLLPLIRMAMSRNPKERPRPGELVDLVGTPKGARILAAARPRPPVAPAVGSVVPLPGSTRPFTAPRHAPDDVPPAAAPGVAGATAGAAGAAGGLAAAAQEWRPSVRSLLQRLLGEPPDDDPGQPPQPASDGGRRAPTSGQLPGSGGGQNAPAAGHQPGSGDGQYAPAAGQRPVGGQYTPAAGHQPGPGGGQYAPTPGQRPGGGQYAPTPGQRPGPGDGQYAPAAGYQPGSGGQRPGSDGGRRAPTSGQRPGSGDGQYAPAAGYQPGSGGGQYAPAAGQRPGPGGGQSGPPRRYADYVPGSGPPPGSGGGQQPGLGNRQYAPGSGQQVGSESRQYAPGSRQQPGPGGGQRAPAQQVAPAGGVQQAPPRAPAGAPQQAPQQAPQRAPGGAPQRAGEQRPVAWSPHLVRPRPLLSVLLLLIVAAAGAHAPFVAVGFLTLAFVLARTVDRQGMFLRLRRDRRGKSASDLVVAVSALPWHAARSALFTVLTVPLAAIGGAAVTVLVALFTPPELAVTNTHVLGALFVGLTAVFAWWGIEGEGVRSGTRRVLGVVSKPRPVAIVAVLVLATVAFGLALNASSGPVEWWPFDDDPRSFVGGIVSWLRAHRVFL